MKRGEAWSVAGGTDWAGKARPVVIAQDDRFVGTLSTTFCPLTTNPTSAPLFRLPITLNERNGLTNHCSRMIDKITTLARTKIGTKIGRLSDEDIVRLNRAVLVFLGLAGASSP